MTWRIPPLGWCAVCLAARNEERPAATLWRGTAPCREHLDLSIPRGFALGEEPGSIDVEDDEGHG